MVLRARWCRLDITEPVAILPRDAKAEEESGRALLRPLSVRSYAPLPGGDAGRIYFRGEFTVTRADQLTQECLDYIVNTLCERTGRASAAILAYLFQKSNVADYEKFPLVIQIQGWKKIPIVPSSMREFGS